MCLYMHAGVSTVSFRSRARIFLQADNSVRVSVLRSTKYAVTSHPFSKWDIVQALEVWLS